jgi:hypothetical protein
MTPASKSMKTAIGTVLLAGLPALVHAQAPTQVPAIMQGSATAAVTVTGPAASRGAPAPEKSPPRVMPGLRRRARPEKARPPARCRHKCRRPCN